MSAPTREDELIVRLQTAEAELACWRANGVTEEILRREGGCIKVGKGCAIVRADEWDQLVAIAAAANTTAVPEVSPPSFSETLPDGRVVGLHPAIRLDEQGRNAVRAIHAWADRATAQAVKEGNFHPGTALAVLMIYRDGVRALDAALAEKHLLPTLTETAAASRPMVSPHPSNE